MVILVNFNSDQENYLWIYPYYTSQFRIEYWQHIYMILWFFLDLKECWKINEMLGHQFFIICIMCETDHCSLSQADLYLNFTNRLRSHTNFLQRLSLHWNRMTWTIIISSKRNPPVVFFQWCSKWKFLLHKFCLNYDVSNFC